MSRAANSKILPTQGHADVLEVYSPAPNFLLSTTTGSRRETNEDRVGFAEDSGVIRLCVTDGHWGDTAADFVAQRMLITAAPKNRDEARKLIGKIEKSLWERFGSDKNPDANTDKTPETSFIAAWYNKVNKSLVVVGYGDVRCMIVGAQKNILIPITNTWLGSFSLLGLRDRISVKEALFFGEYTLSSSDKIILYSDGVDECVYETKTITTEELAGIMRSSDNVGAASESIFKKIFLCGAEDNASIALLFVE
jgi:serine/threonine protein phosphatase PrpC